MNYNCIPGRKLQRRSSRYGGRILQLAVAAVSLQAAHSALALSDSYTDVTSGGNWNVAGSWTNSSSGHTVPVAGDDASLGSTAATSVIFNMSYGTALNSLTINATSPVTFTLTQNASSAMFATTENIGTTIYGNIYAQSAGTNTTTTLNLGSSSNASSQGAYQLSGTGALSVSSENIGNSNQTFDGGNTFTQSGGTNSVTVMNVGIGTNGIGTVFQSAGNTTVTNAIVLGELSGTSGTYNLSGTGNITAGGEFLDLSGGATAVFNQSGGNNTISGSSGVVVGENGAASFNFSGGNLTVTGTDAEALGFGTNSSGTFTQSTTNGASTNNVTNLQIGSAFTTSGPGTYNLQNGNLTTTSGTQSIGNGCLTQTGGTNTLNSSNLEIGIDPTGSVTSNYTLQGGCLTTNGSNVYVGYFYNGNLTQNGGTAFLNFNSTLYVGYAAGSVGNYNLQSGGGLTITIGSEYVGFSGTGIISQSGSTNTISNNSAALLVGYGTGSVGIYSLSAGNLSAAGNETVAYNGNGSFLQTGGNNAIGGSLFIGANLGTGTYYLDSSNGPSSLTAAGEFIGYYSPGNFTQNGGNNTVSSYFELGSYLSGVGNYYFNDGNLTVANGGSEVIGNDGVASFYQSGGNNTVSGQFVIGSAGNNSPGNSSTYEMFSGNLTVTMGETIGTYNFGHFIQSGGTNTVSGTGVLISGGGYSSNYTLSGGVLVTDALVDYGVPGNFIWYGGILQFTTSLTLDPSASTNSTSASFGSSYAIGNNMSLDVTGAETIGGGSPFILSLNTGSNNTAASINITPASTLILNGGTINTSVVSNQGTFISYGGIFGAQLQNYGTANITSSLTITNGLINAGIVSNIALGTTLTLNGAGLNNTGSIGLTGGTISATIATNAGLIAGYGSLQGSPFSNSGVITQTGGNLFINSLTTGFNNTGTINGASGLQMTIAGLAITNDGYINLSGGTINIGPGLTNNFDGTITGPGKLIGIFSNSGTLAVPAGALSISSSWSNTGLLTLTNPAALLGGPGGFTNSGSVQGTGTISEQVITNTGSIEALGGTLAFTFSITNNAGGTLRTTSGTKILMQGTGVFPLNAGLIDLAGGTFDNGGHTLDNTGTIAGYGVLAASTITNDGAMLFTGGTATINANLVNSATRRIDIKYQPALFTGNITNNGIIKTWSTTVTYTGTLTNNAGSTYASDPATNIFQAGLSNAGTVTGGVGDVYIFSGGPVNNSGNFTNGGTLQSSVNFTNSGTFTQSGPQTWSPGTSFTNTAGLASFESNAKLYGLTITGGTVDLTSSKLIVEDTSAHAATLTSMKAYAGSGALTSSVISSNKTFVISDNAVAGLTTFGGFPVDSGSILETVAYKGDANLDGVVDIKDLQDLANHWQQSVTDWSEGDFNGDGIVDIRDLQALANNWQAGVGSGGGSGQSFSEALSLIGSFGGTSSVPEPLSLALLGLGGVVLASRRRHK